MFQYKSVAIQHKLKYIELPDEINLGNPGMNPVYNKVSLDVAGKQAGKYNEGYRGIYKLQSFGS